MRLTPETPTAELKTLVTAQRGSHERQRELERIASLCTARETSVTVTFAEGRAFAHPEDGERADGSQGAYEIVIPTQQYEQVETNLPQPVWDRLIQIAFLFHELGHVRYSDFETFGEQMETVAPQWRNLFQAVYNAVEDAVVETQVANEFNVTEDFVILNRTMATLADSRHRRYVELFDLQSANGTTVLTYTVFEALIVGLLDSGFVDSGRFADIMDPDVEHRVVHDGRQDILEELVPVMDAYVADMLAEPDGTRRVKRACEFFETVKTVFEELAPRQSERLQTAPVRPDDAEGHDHWVGRIAPNLPDAEAARNHVDGQAIGDGSRKLATPPTGEEIPPERTPDDIAAELLEDRANRYDTVGNRNSALKQEAERLLDIVGDADGLDEVVVAEETDDGGDKDRWEEAVRRARRIQDDLQTVLRQERRPETVQSCRTGRLDSRRLVAATQGRQRVFTRHDPTREKDYSCLLLLDRSGSMSGDTIKTAETAIAQLAHPLSEVGVDVSVMSIWRGSPCLEVPFGGRPADHIGRLMTTRNSGGTPLSDGIALARQRITCGSGTYPLVVIITDGNPDDEEAYLSQLDRTTFPVFGVYVGGDGQTDANFFDRLIETDVDTLDQALKQLVRTLFTRKV